jgi:hypothetical protein
MESYNISRTFKLIRVLLSSKLVQPLLWQLPLMISVGLLFNRTGMSGRFRDRSVPSNVQRLTSSKTSLFFNHDILSHVIQTYVA